MINKYKSDPEYRKKVILRASPYIIFKKDSCERCDSPENTICHHKNRNRNDNNQSNIETLCRNCHIAEHLRDANINELSWSNVWTSFRDEYLLDR